MNEGASRETFELEITVEPSDIDVMGHVNNVVYLRWVQDIAIAHWSARTTPEQRAETLWVVVRHEIDYKQPARPGDHIVARTRVGVASRRTFERHTEIHRANGGPLLARARTLWVPVDAATGRVADVSDEIRRQFSVKASTDD